MGRLASCWQVCSAVACDGHNFAARNRLRRGHGHAMIRRNQPTQLEKDSPLVAAHVIETATAPHLPILSLCGVSTPGRICVQRVPLTKFRRELAHVSCVFSLEDVRCCFRHATCTMSSGFGRSPIHRGLRIVRGDEMYLYYPQRFVASYLCILSLWDQLGSVSGCINVRKCIAIVHRFLDAGCGRGDRPVSEITVPANFR